MKPSLLDLALVVVGVAAVTATVVMNGKPTPVTAPAPPPPPMTPSPLPPLLPPLRLDLDLRFAVTHPIFFSADAGHPAVCAEAFDIGVSALRIDRGVEHDHRLSDLIELDVVPLRVGSRPDIEQGRASDCNGGTGRFANAQTRVIVIDDATGRSAACRTGDSTFSVYRGAPAALRCALPTGAARLRFKVVDGSPEEAVVGEFTVDADRVAVAIVNAGAPASERVGDVQDLRPAWGRRHDPAVARGWLRHRVGLDDGVPDAEVCARLRRDSLFGRDAAKSCR